VPRSPSSASHVERLIADLRSGDAVRREAAVARLRVLGARALPRLVAIVESSVDDEVAAHALAALEGTGDTRAMSAALACLDSSSRGTVVAALGVLRGWVAEESGTRVLEAVTAIAVDRRRDARVRIAALDALSDLPEHLVRPIREQAPPEASAGPSLDDPAAARAWVDAHGGSVALSALHDSVTAFAERETASD
jgi:HEAT repeat protein